MKQEKLMNAMNDLDDALIENAAPRGKRSARVLWARVGAVAACFVVAFGVWIGIRNANVPDVSDDVQNDVNNDVDLPPAADIVHPVAPPIPGPSEWIGEAADQGEITIFYVQNDEIVSVTVDGLLTDEAVFDAWCQQNGIGEEVRLVSCQLTSNGKESVVNVNGESISITEPGDKLILTLIVSVEIEAYLSENDREMLLDSLEQTMCAYTEANEYHLAIE